MSGIGVGVGESLKRLLKFEKEAYLTEKGTEGGTAGGFRDWVFERHGKETHRYVEALSEAADRRWRAPPRKVGPDLFSIGMLDIPEYLTRAKARDITGEDIEDDDDEAFEQVHHKSATVKDLMDDALIKLRKAAQGSAAAERRSKQADEARRRARGDTSVMLRDLADKK